MNRTGKWIQLLILTFALFACKKDGKDAGKDPRSLRIKTVTNGSTITSYSYDEQSRQVKAETNQGFYKEELQYEPGKVLWTLTNADGTFKVQYLLGSNGLKLSQEWIGKNEITYFEFNDQQYPVRSYNNQVPVGETKYYYHSGTGLLDSMRTTNGNQWVSTSVFLHYDDKVNTLEEANYGRNFHGRSGACPVRSVAIRRPGNNVSVTSYSYTYDNNNRITSRSFTTSGGQSGTESYTYY